MRDVQSQSRSRREVAVTIVVLIIWLLAGVPIVVFSFPCFFAPDGKKCLQAREVWYLPERPKMNIMR